MPAAAAPPGGFPQFANRIDYDTAPSSVYSIYLHLGRPAGIDFAAVNAANGAGGGTINLDAGCTYTLTTADNGENGLPVVTQRVTVNGKGATITGSDEVRIFEVDGPEGVLKLTKVTLTHGSAGDSTAGSHESSVQGS